MGGGGSKPALGGTHQETSSGSVEKTYYDIVIEQYRKNRLAIWGLRIVAFLILVAVFAPFLSNPRPIVFHGYRYQSYVKSYDQLAYAHADLFGLGRSEKEPLPIPGLYDEGVFLPGLNVAYEKEIQAWESKQVTWGQIRDASFGEAEPLMNAVRRGLEESIEDLIKDRQWARGTRTFAYLKKQEIPDDLSERLDKLYVMAQKNLDQSYGVKADRRRDAVVQQLKQMAAEVSKDDKEAIDLFAERYRSAVTEGFHKRPASDLAEFDQLILRARTKLAPSTVTFAVHTDFPAIRQLEWLDIGFMLFAVLLATVPWWLRFVPGDVAQDRQRRAAAIVLFLPLGCALLWLFAVPAFNDTLDYEKGMQDGSLYSDFRLMAPLRFGINDNDTNAKFLPPWWADFDGVAEKRTADAKAKLAAKDKQAREDARLADPATQAALDAIQRRVDKLEADAKPQKSAFSEFLDFLNRHHMGTDDTGRDLMTRMIWGSRISLSIGFVAVAIYLAIGLVVGALAGYFGGWVDMVTSRAIEIMICFPTFFLILTVIAFLGASIMNIMIVIGLTGWPGVARLVRGEFLRLRKKDFVVAGKALGFSDTRVIFRHVLPNALAPVLVAATFGVARAILVESSLSFLGFGVTVPTPTWGSILSKARESYIYWWITFFPGFAIFLTVTMYNLVGEGIRDAVDPKLRQ